MLKLYDIDDRDLGAVKVYLTDNSLEVIDIDDAPIIFWERDDDHRCDIKGVDAIILSLEAINDEYLSRVVRRHYKLPITIAETENLVLRELALSDLCSLPEELKWTEDFAAAYIESMYELCDFGLWLIVHKATGDIIGRAGIGIIEGQGLELGYEIIDSYRQKGYAVEACRAIALYCSRELDIRQLYVRIEKSNAASWAVYNKIKEIYEAEGITLVSAEL